MPKLKLSDLFFIGKALFLNTIFYLKRQFLNKTLGKPITKPWMKDKEIMIIKEVLISLKPKKCLEWGTGYSTLYFPSLLPKKSTWDSLETNKDWVKKISQLNHQPKTKIYQLKINDYLNFPKKIVKYDFILVDGAQRTKCLKKSLLLISKNGVVILHDANRKTYSKYFKLFKYQLIFKDQRLNQGGLFLGSKGLNISKLFYLQKHQKLWQIYAWLS